MSGALGWPITIRVDVTVVIPSHRRPEKLAACLRSLAGQRLEADRFEVLVGFDGPEPESEALAWSAWGEAGGDPGGLRIFQLEKSGYQAVRNALLPEARGRVLASTNDDVIADPLWLSAHVREHELASASGATVVVSGASPWVVHQPDRLFDRLVRETSMVFFYDVMEAWAARGEPDKDWGFRHAWGLNMSAPTEAVRAVGGFVVLPGGYGYEDNELAFALGERFAARVLYRPEARVAHDHRMEPFEYLRREYLLGYAAMGLAVQRPACARAMFGREILSRDEVEYCRQAVAREKRAASQARGLFEHTAAMPASAVGGAHAPALLRMIYQQHLPLKRWCWRRGLLDSFEGRPCEPGPALDELDASGKSAAGVARPGDPGATQTKPRAMARRTA